ncbi:hypothetical protein ACWEOI_32545 [Nocardia sp. NPDC004340]
MGLVARLWDAGLVPLCDGIYRPDDTGLELDVDGPGAYHPDAGQPIPFDIGGSFDVVEAIEEYGTYEFDTYFEAPIPDGSGLMTGGGYAARGNNGYIARVNSAGSLQWVAPMFDANPFIGVHYEGMTAVLTNNWRNHLRLDLTHPALR